MQNQLISMNVTQVGVMRFSAKTSHGAEILSEPSPMLGGSGAIPNPMEYLIASIGTCAAIKIQLDLTKMGCTPKSIGVKIECSQKMTPPQVLEHIHLAFTLSGMLDEEKVSEAIHEVMILYCPVAVMVGRSSTITWDHQILDSVPE
ncbi:MAG TPA: OsmC family protein [Methanospirillum sp.]|nr:OsmC family protein [Methanospirillum sp.]